MSASENNLLNKKQLAELLQVSVRTVERWVCEARIPYIPLPRRGSRVEVRFRWADIARWLEKRQVQPVRWSSRLSSPTPRKEVTR